MDSDIVEEILRRIDELGSALSEGTAHGFEILVRQQIINGITNLVWGVILGVVALLLAKYLIPSARAYGEEVNESRREYGRTLLWEDWVIPRIPFLAVAPISAIMASVMFTTGIRELVNPQYYAIYEILQAIN